MHLTELIENNTFVAVAVRNGRDRDTCELSAVKFSGWITVNGRIRDEVKISDRFYSEFRMQGGRRDENNGFEKDPCAATVKADASGDFKKFAGCSENAIVIACDEKEAEDFFSAVGLSPGAGVQNRALYIAEIARNNYRDKLRDYSFEALAARFGGKNSSKGEPVKAETVAGIFARIALEDDIAHCGY